MYLSNGQAERAFDTAAEHGPQLLHKYLAKHVSHLIADGKTAEALPLYKKYGAPAFKQASLGCTVLVAVLVDLLASPGCTVLVDLLASLGCTVLVDLLASLGCSLGWFIGESWLQSWLIYWRVLVAQSWLIYWRVLVAQSWLIYWRVLVAVLVDLLASPACIVLVDLLASLGCTVLVDLLASLGCTVLVDLLASLGWFIGESWLIYFLSWFNFSWWGLVSSGTMVKFPNRFNCSYHSNSKVVNRALIKYSKNIYRLRNIS